MEGSEQYHGSCKLNINSEAIVSPEGVNGYMSNNDNKLYNEILSKIKSRYKR